MGLFFADACRFLIIQKGYSNNNLYSKLRIGPISTSESTSSLFNYQVKARRNLSFLKKTARHSERAEPAYHRRHSIYLARRNLTAQFQSQQCVIAGGRYRRHAPSRRKYRNFMTSIRRFNIIASNPHKCDIN